MSKSTPKLRATKPKNVFTKPLQVNFKDLFKPLSSAVGHLASGKWEEIANDTVEALSAIGIATDPGELAFLLIRRSLTRALFDLVGESAAQQLAGTEVKADALVKKLTSSVAAREVQIDSQFLDRPADSPLIQELQSLLQQWLEGLGVATPAAQAIIYRFPCYFVYALNNEWRQNAKSYRPLIDALDTPFARAGEREWGWTAYSALLKLRIHEGIFDEPFSLSQLYIPLNAYFSEEHTGAHSADEMALASPPRRRVVVALQEELQNWLQNPNQHDAIRVISGGPGSGKSSFLRIFAARLSDNSTPKVLYVPLHLIDPTKDLVDEIGRFVRDEGVLLQNPLDPDSPEPNLLIIFDGLDELASQGKVAAETARAFVGEIYRTVEKRNMQGVKLRVLISGRELVVQENESEFRRPRQIMTLLPYLVPQSQEYEHSKIRDGDEYHDPNNLLKIDLREQWWSRYGRLTGKGFMGLPENLGRHDLTEITAQPLLNYLVALSFTRGKLDFTKNINLNSIYADLVGAVHERGYEKYRAYGPIRHMTLDEFCRVLEEIGLAAWHGDGRTTTVKEIEEHCRDSGVGKLLDAFQEGAKVGVTRLLAAFFFRRYGQRPSGDPTFVFTHKSFGEYLTARRVVRAIQRLVRELDHRDGSPDEGWDERDALKHWAQICGPSAISGYLHTFLRNEAALQDSENVARWQSRLAKLFSYVLRHGMPMEQFPFMPFREALLQSRNAEEALLVALNVCAHITQQVSAIDQHDPIAFGAWFRRIQGQRTGPIPTLAARCLSFLDLSDAILHITDFYGADISFGVLPRAGAVFASFGDAALQRADFSHAELRWAGFLQANLERANLSRARLEGAHFERANLEGANLSRARLEGAHFERANLSGARLEGANLEGANLEGANLEGANLEGAKLEGAKLKGAKLKGVKLKGAILPKRFRAIAEKEKLPNQD